MDGGNRMFTISHLGLILNFEKSQKDTTGSYVGSGNNGDSCEEDGRVVSSPTRWSLYWLLAISDDYEHPENREI